MTAREPDIIFAYEGGPHSEQIASEFTRIVEHEDLNLVLERMPSTRAFAGIELLMMTAIVAYVSKAYFDGFLGEAGREHYQALKKGVKHVAERVGRFPVTRVSTPGKLVSVQRYSLIFSILLQRDAQTRFKFLIPVDLSPEETEAAMDAFFVFLDGWYAGSMADADRQRFEDAPANSRTVLLAYRPETKRIEIVDPFADLIG